MSILPRDLLLDLANKTPVATHSLFTHLGYKPQTVNYSVRTLDWPDNMAAELRGRSFELLADLDAFHILLLPPHHKAKGTSLVLQCLLYRWLKEWLNKGMLVLPNRERGLFELVLLMDTRTAKEKSAKASISFPRFSFDPCALLPHHQRALELMEAHGIVGVEVGEHLREGYGRAQQETLFSSQNFFSRHCLEQRIAANGDGIGTTRAVLLNDAPTVTTTAADLQPCPELALLDWKLFSGSGSLFFLRSGGNKVGLLAILPENVPMEQQVTNEDDQLGNYPQLTLIAALEQAKKQKQQDITWGVLTNGRTCRLYSTLTSSVFYEVDLYDLLQFGNAEDTSFFSGFFGAVGLASRFAKKVFYASQTLAKRVGENLKKTIFEQVFEELATSIADHRWRHGVCSEDEAQYRLIFCATHSAYYPHRLTRLLTDIAIQPFLGDHKKRPSEPTAYWAWDWFRDLWGAVSRPRPRDSAPTPPLGSKRSQIPAKEVLFLLHGGG